MAPWGLVDPERVHSTADIVTLEDKKVNQPRWTRPRGWNLGQAHAVYLLRGHQTVNVVVTDAVSHGIFHLA